MKKQTKIVALLLTLALVLSGVIIAVGAADGEAAAAVTSRPVKILTNNADVLNAIKADGADTLAAPSGNSIADDNFEAYIITEGGKDYFMMSPDVTNPAYDVANMVRFDIKSTASRTADTIIVQTIDVASIAGYVGGALNFKLLSGGSTNGTPAIRVNNNTVDGNWHRIVSVEKVGGGENNVKIFVDGVCAGTGTCTSTGKPGISLTTTSADTNRAFNDNFATYIDNANVTVYTSEDTANYTELSNILADDTKNLNDNWTIYTNNTDKLPASVKVDGTAYTMANDAQAALDADGAHTLELVSTSAYKYTVGLGDTVITNGFDNFKIATGTYAKETAQEGVYEILVDTRTSDVTFKNGDTVIAKLDGIAFGTNLKDLASEKSVFLGTAKTVFVDRATQTIYTADPIIGATANAEEKVIEFTNVAAVDKTAYPLFYSFNINTGEAVAGTQTDKGCVETFASGNMVVILNADVKPNSDFANTGNDLSVPQNANPFIVDFNGYNFIVHYKGDPQRFFNISYELNATFQNGSMTDEYPADAAKKYTTDFVCANNANVSLKLVDVNFDMETGLIRARKDVTLVIKNSNISLGSQSSYSALVYGNEQAANNGTFDIQLYNSTIDVKTTAKFSMFWLRQGSAADFAPNPFNLVIDNCTINSPTMTLFTFSNKFTAGTTAANSSIKITNSVINAKGYSNANKNAIPLTIENTYTSFNVTTKANHLVESDVKCIKTGDDTYKNFFTKFYATVTWSDGTTSYHLPNTIPSNPNCPTDLVHVLKAGEVVTFVASEYTGAAKINLTLDSGIKYNICFPADSGVTGLLYKSVDVEPTDIEIDGVAYKKYTIGLSPKTAANYFNVVIKYSEDWIVKTLNMIDYLAALKDECYADGVIIDTDEAKNTVFLVNALAYYIKNVYAFTGSVDANLKTKLDGIIPGTFGTAGNGQDGDFYDHRVTQGTKSAEMSDEFKAYVESVGYVLDSEFEFVLTLKNANVTVAINGTACDVVDGKVSYRMNATQILDLLTIEITDGDTVVTGEYDFGRYSGHCVTSNQAGITSWVKITEITKGIISYSKAATKYAAMVASTVTE